jgi:hypothetical protein
MAFTLDNLAAELGIDPATLQAKPEVAAKWNGYLTEADTKYTQATASERKAAEDVERAQREQAEIDRQIRSFGVTETRLTELETANAALTAALGKAKEMGLNVDLSGIPKPAPVAAADPTKVLNDTMRSGFAQMGEALRVQARFQAVFNKPFVDDPVRLVDEAIAAKLPVAEYAERKYKFSEETERIRQAEVQARIDAGVSAGVKKYQEEHPVTAGHRGLAPGLASRHPQVFKPRTAQETNDFRRMPVRDRIAASVSHVREALASNAE